MGFGEEAEACRLDEDARSRGDGDAFLDLDRSNSFNRLVRNKPSNCTLKSFAHASSYSPFGPFRSDILLLLLFVVAVVGELISRIY